MTSPIPSFYRTWFTVIDPILSIVGVFTNILAPTTILKSFNPSSTTPPAPETIFILDQSAGFFACLTFLQLGILRARPADVGLYRAVQAGTLMVDLAMLAGFARTLGTQGRLGLAGWRAEEWTNIGITVGVAVIRTTFLLGLGMEGRGKGKKKA